MVNRILVCLQVEQVDSVLLELESRDGSNKRKLGMLGTALLVVLCCSDWTARCRCAEQHRLAVQAGRLRGGRDPGPVGVHGRVPGQAAGGRGGHGAPTLPLVRVPGTNSIVSTYCCPPFDQDERTCRDFDFPVVLSGHDHHKVDRVVEVRPVVYLY